MEEMEMKNIFSEPYKIRAENRLGEQLKAARRNAPTTKKQPLTPAEKLEFDQMNPSDRLKFLRNLEVSNIGRVTKLVTR